MSRDTLRAWLQERWAKDLLDRLHDEHTREMVNEVRAVASLALEKVRDRLENDPKLSARDGAIIFGILSEKAVLWSEQAPREKEPVTPEGKAELDTTIELLTAELVRRRLAERSGEETEH